MKIRHLLLGLMICVAGTGAIDLSGGFLDDQNTTRLTPFLIFGHVLYEGGAPCNNPNVSITNLDTGAARYADTVSGSNFYQTIPALADVNAGDVLRWSVTDGTVFDTANRTVGQGDLDSGGIFNFDVILQSIAPGIIGYAPESQIRDIGNATRTLDITVDRVVDVTWLINGTEVSDEADVNESSYTNTSASIGVWNVSAIAENGGGTDTQTRIWNVDPPSPPSSSPMFVIYGAVFYEDNMPVYAPCVVMTNLNTSREFVADNRSGENFYQLITDVSEICTGDLLMINASKDGVLVGNGNVEHIVTMDESRIGVIRVDINQGWADLRVAEISTPPYIFDNVTNTINATIANNGTTGSEGFNVSLAVDGVVVGRADIESLGVGCAADVTFNWTPHRTGNHTLTVTADADGEIDESNETNNATSVSVFVGVPDFTIADLAFDTPVNLYDGVNINAVVANYGVRGDTVEVGFYVDDNATPFNATEVFVLAGGTSSVATIWNATLAAHHNITAVADPKNSTPERSESNNSLSRQIFVDASDLTVTGICITGYVSDPEYPDETDLTFEYPNNVTAAIANIGNLSADAIVEFHSELNRSGELIFRHLGGFHNTSNDTITQPNASKLRVHFSYISVGINSYINIYDKNNNTAETLTACPADGWSNWVDGNVIRMHAYIGGTDESVWFAVDKYEYIFADATVSLDAHNSTNVSRIWHADPAIITDGAQSRYVMWHLYNISVIADPDDTVTELNESNNGLNTPAELWYPYDFTITNISFSPERPREGEPVTIDAAIGNLGFRSIDTDVAFYVDGNLLETVDVYAEANGTEHVSAIWDALPDINHLTEEHNITVVVDPNNEVEEWSDLNNIKFEPISVTLANLTITDISTDPAGMIVGDTVDVITTIRNNEDAAINSTVWFCEENDSIDIHDYKAKPKSPIIHHITHQGALMMRTHYTATVSVDTDGIVKVYINDRPVLTCDGENCPLEGWTEWTSGSTGIVNITLVEEKEVTDDEFGIHYSIDRYQTMFGNTGLTMSASESVNLSMNWTVIQKNPRLIVTASNATNSMNVSVSGIDLAVTDVSVSDDIVWDGDLVNINATITNFGGMNASNFTVEFYDILLDVYDPDPVLITVEDVSRLDAGDSMNVTVPWTASPKVGRDISYKHLIGVNVIPQDSYIEDNSTNNTGYSDVITVTRSRDFSVTGITFLLNNETVDPTDLQMGALTTINATMEITNLASCGGSVDVVCYLDSTLIDRTAVPFPAGNGTLHAEFEWVVCDHGNHTITVIADPENKTSEFDELNNASSQPICIRAPDLVVTDLSFDPESPEEGRMVNITADVGNLGNLDADNVNLTIYDCTDATYYEYGSPYRRTPGQTVAMGDATAMRLYTKLQLWGGSLYFYDCQNQLIASYNASFNGRIVRTPWAFGNYITMEYEGAGWGDMWVHGIEYTTVRDTITTTNLTLVAGGAASIAATLRTSLPGEHQVFAIIDPENRVWESDESNNEFVRTLIVRGADLTVSDMRVTANGTGINGTETVIVAGDVVNISAIVTNIGIRPASNFSVSFYANDAEIANTTNLSLNIGEFVNVSAEWNSTIGNYTITVTADPEKQIHETNESNNTAVMDVSVQGADLLITNTTYAVIPPGNATLNDTCDRVYDTDTILINTTIANQGVLPADNFSAHIFYEEKGLGGYEFQYYKRGWMWRNKTLEGVGCVCVGIMNAKNVKDNIKIYDQNGSLAVSPEGDGWFFVDGDEANVHYNSNARIEVSMSAHAGDVWRHDHLSIGTGKSMNLTVTQQVFTGDHPIRVFVDLEDRVCENSYENNYADMALTVYPSRDFAINDMQLFHNGSPIGVNDTIRDGDRVFVDATVRMGINKSDPYHEYRKGDADVAIINEHEWANISPRFELTPYGYAQVITHPGADAIKVHFGEMRLAPYAGCVEIRDKNGTVQWSRGYYDGATDQSSWVDGDVIYVHNVEKTTYYNYVWGRTTFSIDKYQYRRSNHTTVSLAADETGDITTGWNVSAGSHTIQATVDREDAVGEINESNNEMCRTLHIDACKDPVILNITFNPEKPAVGSDVAINAAIMNKGDRNATFTVDLWAEKTEYHPFESPHDKYFPPMNCEWEIPSTYPAADWMGIHFARIEMSSGTGDNKLNRNLYVRDGNNTIADNLCGLNETDIQTRVKGDTTKLSTTPCTLFPDYPVPVWGFEITDHIYKIVLNRTTLTLAPNETVDVTGILRNVRAGNHSMNYTIHASIDTGNVIYEVNESNNEMVRVLNLAVPDFTVKIQHRQDGNIRAVFRNSGFGSADARIFFSRDINVDDLVSGSHYRYVPNKTVRKSIDWTDAVDWTRIHFEEMKIREGGYIEVGNEQYKESKSDFWSPWVKGDRINIKYRTARFKIDRYDFAVEDIIYDFGAGSEKFLNIPWEGYTEPYNLTVWIDPLNEALEGNEDDNNATVFVYADLVADRIMFVSPAGDKLCLDAEKFIIDGHIRNGNGDRDDIIAPVSDFDVMLEVRNWYSNGTVGDLVFNMTEHVDDPIYGGEDKVHKIRFEFDPNEKFEVGGNYTVSLMVDLSGDICESNEENNNITSENIYIYERSGYAGGGDLVNIAQGEVNGRVVYTIGDSDRLPAGGFGAPAVGSVRTLTVTYDDTIPDGAEVEFARLYLYVDTGSNQNRRIALPIEVDMEFNGHEIRTDRRYTDISVASHWNVTYGLYCYDITNIDIEKENVAVATRISPKFDEEYYFGIAAIGLLVVYEDEDEPLMKYWINEGADVMMPSSGTGLSFEDCIVTAEFDDVKREDLNGVNATLMTILSLVSGGEDVLKFNGHEIGSHWTYQRSDDRDPTIAMTDNKWEYVTDDLRRGNNLAEIQSLGNYMMTANAFLRLIFPPDLNVINLTAPASTVVGAHHSINTTIRNDGKSDAHDFNMTFYIDGKQMVRIPHLDLAAGENMTIHLYNWTPMMLMHIYNLTAAADILSGEDWTEIETDNNAITKRVLIEESGFGNQTGPRGIGGGSNPTGGEFTEPITGRIMQGIKEFLGGGGGGAGMFSRTEWIMKGAVWLVLLFFVGLGYRMEQRSYRG